MGEPSQGLFSGVLSYVSREVGSFVTNATGGVISVNTGHQQPKKRVKHKKNAPTSSHKASSSSRTTMPGSLFPRSPSMAPTMCGDFGNDPDSDLDDQPGPSKRARHETPSERYATPPSFVSSPSPTSSKRKGKQKATTENLDEYSDEDVLAMPPPPLPISRHAKGKERQTDSHDTSAHLDSDTSGEIRVRGKERELSIAREQHMLNQQRWERDRDKVENVEDWERDKERIRVLEEEVRRLREEVRVYYLDVVCILTGNIQLSKRSTYSTTTTANHLPPPPPPPPPPATIIRAPSAGDPKTLFASARASLKHTTTPTEAPINPAYSSLSSSLSGSRRTGKPTVGLQPDKIADFLKEMKTVRLRKVGLPPGELDPSASLSFSASTRADLSLSRSTRSRRDSGSTGDSSARIDPDASDLGHILNFRSRDKNVVPNDSEIPNGARDDSVRKRKRVSDEGEGLSRRTGQVPTSNSQASTTTSAPSLPVPEPRRSQETYPTVIPRKPSSFASTVSVDTDSSAASSQGPTSSKPTSTSISKRNRNLAISNAQTGQASSRPSLSQIQRHHSPHPAPPMSKSPSARTSTSFSPSGSPPPGPLSRSQQLKIYTLPSGTIGPSRAWAPSAVLPAAQTPSLCSDLPEGSASIDDDWHGENDDIEMSHSQQHVVPRVVVSPRPRVERGQNQKDIIDVDAEMDDVGGVDMDVEAVGDYYPYRANAKTPPIPTHPAESSTSPTSPRDNDAPFPSASSRHLLPPFSETEPAPKPSSRPPPSIKPSSAAAAFSKRPPVSPMPITPSPQRPRPPASKGKGRGRGRALDIIGDTMVRVEQSDTPAERDSQSRRRSRSHSRSRPPTPYARVTRARERPDSDEEDEQAHGGDDPADLKTEQDDGDSSEDPLSLGGDTSAESIPQTQLVDGEQSRGRKPSSKKAGGPSRILVVRSGSLKGKGTDPAMKQHQASTSRKGEATRSRVNGLAKASSRIGLSSSMPTTTTFENHDDFTEFSANAKSRRRRTLDDELRSAVDARRSEDEELYEADDGEDADGAGVPKYVKHPKIQGGRTISAVGTRSKKKGYLAHGGAGGAPLFMGVGSVEGVEDDGSDYVPDPGDDEDEEDYVPTRKSNAGNLSRRRS
ncbi:hypothetical protein VNI00_007924 [Paramarasmius palmivorus]|uniref:Uncharacterized protein n=1 Tax=Paramarasmius palmivorus TaxID=297713 RepID=A0AAW0CY21_9AGAR